jgi:CDP-diacylglycerol--serine O-phosphatidyltransferase
MDPDNAQTLSRRARGLYQVTFSDHSMRELNKLAVEDQLALVDKISNVTPEQLDEPGDAIGKFHRDGLTYYRVRAGDFRCYFEIKGDTLYAHSLHSREKLAHGFHLPKQAAGDRGNHGRAKPVFLEIPRNPQEERFRVSDQGDESGNVNKEDVPTVYVDSTEASKIYFLPNLMTAGNLFCGFVAIIRCIQAKFTASTEGVGAEFLETVAKTPAQLYEQAVWFILAAVIFDMLDGRMARMTRKESLFGKEFDSLADVVSFGLAPALLVFFLLLSPTEEFPLVRTLGGLVGFFYLLCSAVRLARYNVLTTPLLPHGEAFPKDDFLGLPVPAAAGMVSF